MPRSAPFPSPDHGNHRRHSAGQKHDAGSFGNQIGIGAENVNWANYRRRLRRSAATPTNDTPIVASTNALGAGTLITVNVRL